MDVTREVDLESSVDEVWELLTDSDELSGWFGDDVSLDATPGGEGTFVEDGLVRRAVVEEVEAGRHLSFRWWVDGDEESASRVAFTITETDAGTHLTVTETACAACAAAASVLWVIFGRPGRFSPTERWWASSGGAWRSPACERSGRAPSSRRWPTRPGGA